VTTALLLPAAIFTVNDTFVTLRGVDGPGAARRALGPLTFQLTALGRGAAWQALAPGWTLTVVQGASGAFISDGTITDPDGNRRRPIGPPLDLELVITSAAYRSTPLPPPAAPGQPLNAAPRLVNLDRAQPPVAVTPFPVQLSPGYGYPFPGPPYGYAILRGEVSSRSSGLPVAQSQVSATAPGGWTDSYTTDSTGQWVFVLPDSQAGSITVTAGAARATVPVAASSVVGVPPLILP
jgi:hypothetical protein